MSHDSLSETSFATSKLHDVDINLKVKLMSYDMVINTTYMYTIVDLSLYDQSVGYNKNFRLNHPRSVMVFQGHDAYKLCVKLLIFIRICVLVS